jgi:hypothetical protein
MQARWPIWVELFHGILCTWWLVKLCMPRGEGLGHLHRRWQLVPVPQHVVGDAPAAHSGSCISFRLRQQLSGVPHR